MTSSPRMTLQTALVLKAIEKGHRYGFDIMDATGLPDGSIYPILRRLDDAGLVTAEWEDEREARKAGRPTRKYYALTDSGREMLAVAVDSYPLLAAMGDVSPAEA